MDHQVFRQKAMNQDPQYMAINFQQIYEVASDTLPPEHYHKFQVCIV